MKNKQREIKFRAWDKNNKKWVGSVGFYTQKYSYKPDSTSIVSIGFPNEVVLMQYTGLKDKNGVEIYEGDILLGRFVLDNVEDHVFLQLTDKEKKEQTKIFVVEDIFYLYINPMPDDLEVIGNIYENPELLEDLK